MATLYENYITGDDHRDTIAEEEWNAQTFTPSVSHTIASVKLKLHRLGSPGDLTVSIRATSGSLPYGGDLCSGTTNGNTLTAASSGEWREISLGVGTPLTSGIEYAICIRALDGTQWTDHIFWFFDQNDSTYTDGDFAYSSNSGVDWSGVADNDHMFEEWGEGTGYPIVSTQACTNTIARVSTGHGSLFSIGGSAVTQHGHCWDTSTNPTTSLDTKTENGAAPNLGQFSSFMTGLAAGTTYYVRAYATNSSGTAYGGNVTITTGATIGKRYWWTEKDEFHWFDEWGNERFVKGTAITGGDAVPWWLGGL